jgi:hypothetical protein
VFVRFGEGRKRNKRRKGKKEEGEEREEREEREKTPPFLHPPSSLSSLFIFKKSIRLPTSTLSFVISPSWKH